MSTVGVVTDSTAYLPAQLAAEHRVLVVPLQVVVDGTAYDEGTGVSPATLTDALRRHLPVSTSRPAPETVAAAYRRAVTEGAGQIVSVHRSGDMSGTVESAALAAREAPVPVHVVDSRSMGMGLGYAVLAAAREAAGGASGAEVARVARRRAAAADVLFYVESLDQLRRGGRIGAARALLGSALAVKPLLHLDDGRIAPLEKVRTASRAQARLADIALERAGSGPVDVAVHHLDAPGPAAALAARLREGLESRLGELYVVEVGAVVGAHVGPGLLAVVLSPR